MSDVIQAVADADGAEAIRQKYLEARPMWKIVLGQFLEIRMLTIIAGSPMQMWEDTMRR